MECEATGVMLEIPADRDGSTKFRRFSFTPSLDRIDPDLGYTPENSRIVCWLYNAGKSQGSDQDMRTMIAYMIQKTMCETDV